MQSIFPKCYTRCLRSLAVPLTDVRGFNNLLPQLVAPFASRTAATHTFRYASREEERIIKTSLHDVGTQFDSMKLSLKIYHFQELSKTSLTNAVLRRDDRYETLKEDLRTNALDLSPAQLVAASVSAGRLNLRERRFWWALARGVMKHTQRTKSGFPGLQHSEICLFLHNLSKTSVKIKTVFYFRMLKHMSFNPELWTEFDMAWILGAMRRRRLMPKDEDRPAHRLWGKILSSISTFFGQKMHFISPRGIVCILHEFSRQGFYPGKQVFPAMKRVRQNVPALADRSLVSLAQVLARFDWPDKRMLRKISHELREPRRFLRIHPNMFIVVLNAYAKLRVRDVALLEAICGLLARGCNQLSPRSCAEAANSLGRLGVRGPVWAELATKVQEQVDRHGPLQLALIAHGFGKAAVREEKLLMESLAEASLAVIPGFSAKHLACLLDGFVLMGCLHQELFSEAMDEYVRIGSVGGRERHQMMSRVVSSMVLEAPSFFEDIPSSWEGLLTRYKTAQTTHQRKPRSYHEELTQCAQILSLPAKIFHQRGHHFIDMYIAATDARPIALHLFAEAEFCPLTQELLGPSRLRQRHLEQMQCICLGLRRKEWLSLEDTSSRASSIMDKISSLLPHGGYGGPKLLSGHTGPDHNACEILPADTPHEVQTSKQPALPDD